MRKNFRRKTGFLYFTTFILFFQEVNYEVLLIYNRFVKKTSLFFIFKEVNL